ncbi:hypothetical protein [Roseomonas harenae]|jgi:hypothetical protein|uniref:hypothetical protein n=1 Tax=Muricoccus harenae TaxID=2692566 RepID=UPI001F2F88DE|nr:hypothetical protein [Roseomonas harenae]
MFDAVPGALLEAPVPVLATEEEGERVLSVRYLLRAEPSPGLLPRLLQPLAKRDLVPDRMRAAREGAAMRVELAVTLPEGMVHLVAGNLRSVVGVMRLEVEHGRVAGLAA